MAAKEIRRAKLRERMFGDRAFYAEMISVVVPIIIQNTVSNVVSLLDNVMVGRVGTLQMSAVAIINQLLFVFNLCIFGGLAGAGIFATQYAGAHDHKGVRDCFRVKWMISLSMLACALAVFIALPKQLIGMYLAEETAQADAAATLGFGMDYLTVMLWGLLPFGVTQVYASTLREVGETRLPMLASVAAILVNLVFNYFLIFGKCGFPEMGVTGAAIATVLSRYIETAIIVVYTHTRKEYFPFIHGAYRSLRVPSPLMSGILHRGTPLLVNEFLWSSGMAVLRLPVDGQRRGHHGGAGARRERYRAGKKLHMAVDDGGCRLKPVYEHSADSLCAFHPAYLQYGAARSADCNAASLCHRHDDARLFVFALLLLYAPLRRQDDHHVFV